MARTWIFALPLVTGLLGACAMENPLFGDNANSGEEGTASDTGSEDATASMSGGESASDSNSSSTDSDSDSTTDSDSNSTTDSDSTTNSTTDSDSDSVTDTDTETETGEQLCEPDLHPPLRPTIGKPSDYETEECPEFLENVDVAVTGMDGPNWSATLCNGSCGEGCFGPPVSIGLGPGHPINLPMMYPPGTPNDPACFVLEADYLNEDFDDCVYSSMTISGGTETEVILFHANRDGAWPDSDEWFMQINGWWPLVVPQEEEDCLCHPDLDIDCCVDEVVVPHMYLLDEEDTSAYPGNWSMPFVIPQADTFKFYAAQAQVGGICELEPETSWALQRL